MSWLSEGIKKVRKATGLPPLTLKNIGGAAIGAAFGGPAGASAGLKLVSGKSVPKAIKGVTLADVSAKAREIIKAKPAERVAMVKSGVNAAFDNAATKAADVKRAQQIGEVAGELAQPAVLVGIGILALIIFSD